ncbi:MAG: hypothetical protein JW889_06460 [Verrucomicrobia bacterium]|nr:hypothetical protein [Verrucomicrobiota bacterium]
MARSVFIIIVCIAAIAGSAFYYFSRPQSAAERERDMAGWRICAECGREWHMTMAHIAAQMEQNPDGIGAVQCPNCHAWRGMVRAECPKCHKSFPRLVAVETDDGLSLEKQTLCPHCGCVFGEAETAGNGPADQ